MPNYKASALTRHDYLLSRFQAYPYPGDVKGRVELRFCGNLPRASKLAESINTAMRGDGIVIPEGSVSISLEKAHEINYLRGLFVSAAPETVLIDGHLDTVYSFGCSKAFRAKEGSSAAAIIEYASRDSLVLPSPIAGIRSGRAEIYNQMHTALRKVADSKITSAAWNAMHIIDSDTREWLVGIVAPVLSGSAYATSEEVVKAVKAAFEADETAIGIPPRQMMASLFAVFDDDDWTGMLGFCIIWPYEVAAAEKPAPVVASSSV